MRAVVTIGFLVILLGGVWFVATGVDGDEIVDVSATDGDVRLAESHADAVDDLSDAVDDARDHADDTEDLTRRLIEAADRVSETSRDANGLRRDNAAAPTAARAAIVAADEVRNVAITIDGAVARLDETLEQLDAIAAEAEATADVVTEVEEAQAAAAAAAAEADRARERVRQTSRNLRTPRPDADRRATLSPERSPAYGEGLGIRPLAGAERSEMGVVIVPEEPTSAQDDGDVIIVGRPD